jgi:uncharacterized protein (UPF0276 family)
VNPVPLDGVGLGLRWEFLDDVLGLLDAKGALDAIGFFEISPENYMRRGGFFPAALDRVRARFPLLSHGLTMSLGGVDPLGDEYMRELRAFVRRMAPPFHSDHLCFCGTGGRLVHELLPVPFTPRAAMHMSARIREAQDRLETAVAVENITHYAIPGRALMDEAAFIGEVLDRSGAGLVLDVNNVFVNAKNSGFAALEFLERMPLDRVVEIHIAGHERVGEHDVVVDTHGAPVIAPVFDLLGWVIERTGPVPVLLERDNNVPSLGELLAELGAVRCVYDAALARRKACSAAAPTEEARHG